MNILVSLPFFPSEWREWDWPGKLIEWRVKRGVVDQPIYPRVDAWIVDPDTTVGGAALSQLKDLKVVATASTGTDHIDVDRCKSSGIKVFSLLDDRKGLNEIKASSEGTFMLLLMVLRNARRAIVETMNGRWHENLNLMRGNELYGKKVGIIGYGRIGKNITRWCEAFGARVYVNDPYSYDARAIWNKAALFEFCDIVVICCSLTNTTKHLISGELLCKLKQGATLINTARGEVIDEQALAEVLVKRPDIRVGVDVLTGMGLGRPHASPLTKFNNVTVLPHIAGCTYESNEKAARIVMGLLWDYSRSSAKSVE